MTDLAWLPAAWFPGQAKPIPTLDVADSLEATRNLLTDSPSQKSKLEEMREK